MYVKNKRGRRGLERGDLRDAEWSKGKGQSSVIIFQLKCSL